MYVAIISQKGSCNSSTFNCNCDSYWYFIEIGEPGIKWPQDNTRVKCYSSLSSGIEPMGEIKVPLKKQGLYQPIKHSFTSWILDFFFHKQPKKRIDFWDPQRLFRRTYSSAAAQLTGKEFSFL